MPPGAAPEPEPEPEPEPGDEPEPEPAPAPGDEPEPEPPGADPDPEPEPAPGPEPEPPAPGAAPDPLPLPPAPVAPGFGTVKVAVKGPPPGAQVGQTLTVVVKPGLEPASHGHVAVIVCVVGWRPPLQPVWLAVQKAWHTVV